MDIMTQAVCMKYIKPDYGLWTGFYSTSLLVLSITRRRWRYPLGSYD